MQKVSKKTDLDNTKITSMISYRGGDITDAARLYRKEQILKKKLKNILDTNGNLEKQIKTHESQIKDERASVQFQLGDLIKQMTLKFGHFCQEKLEKQEFPNNAGAHRTIQNMMVKYQAIEKQCLMMGKVFESLQKIHQNYKNHSSDMQEMVLQSQGINQQYQSSMECTIHNICEQIKSRSKENQHLDNTTQEMIKDIDNYVEGMVTLEEEESRVLAKIDKLKKMANCQQEKVNQISEWAEIVIDKSNRKTVQKTMKEKQQYLRKMQRKNQQLEIYFHELENQEKSLLNQKENIARPKSKSVKSKKKASTSRRVRV